MNPLFVNNPTSPAGAGRGGAGLGDALRGDDRPDLRERNELRCDGMDRLWAPWRMEYIVNDKPGGCIFCGVNCTPDRERLILYRTEHSLVMLNRYPYTNGHLLIAPLRHVAGLDGLDDAEMLDLFKVLRLGRKVLQESAGPQGYNIGVNLGRASGAGVEDHLHLHIVPRWVGDTNFTAVIDDLRVVPEGLLATYDRLLPLFQREEDGA